VACVKHSLRKSMLWSQECFVSRKLLVKERVSLPLVTGYSECTAVLLAIVGTSVSMASSILCVSGYNALVNTVFLPLIACFLS
jgi:hypothetical protein